MRKVEPLPTRDCEAGYGPVHETVALRVRTVAKRHVRSSVFTASFILVSCVKLPYFLE